jgi:antitoxin component HigA of HigAB toxin-antitoxin module
MVAPSVIKALGIKPCDVARALGISSGHASDLKNGRRRLTVEQAAKLEAETGRKGIIAAVVAERTGSPARGAPKCAASR